MWISDRQRKLLPFLKLYLNDRLFSIRRSSKGYKKMSFLPLMQKGNLDAAHPDRHGKITKETVALDGVSVTRVTFDVGAKWSQDLKEYAGTNSCQLPHVALVLSGTLRVVMDDGSQQDFSRNDVMMLPPGHDAWSV